MARRLSATSPTVADLARVMDTIAPPSLAQPWDNVGLLAGDRAAPCGRILLCIDLTRAVLREAVRARCGAVIAYHPPLFQPVRRLLADSHDTDAILHAAIAAGVAIYSPHTALDAAPGGTNDVMAELCGLTGIGPFEYVPADRAQNKIVTFVPREQVERVASATWAAGAGRIGDYERCSFRTEGTGTFFGTDAANPQVGEKGRLERVPEVRLEMVAPTHLLPEVVEALRRSHPYEEPAIDIHPLTAEMTAGIGRVGDLPAGTTLKSLARRLARATGSRVATCVGDPRTKLKRAAVCVGAAGRLPIEKPRAAGCDVVITGEIRHHDALTLLRHGKSAVALGHWESERPALQPLARRLKQMLPGAAVRLSGADAPPFAPAD